MLLSSQIVLLALVLAVSAYVAGFFSGQAVELRKQNRQLQPRSQVTLEEIVDDLSDLVANLTRRVFLLEQATGVEPQDTASIVTRATSGNGGEEQSSPPTAIVVPPSH